MFIHLGQDLIINKKEIIAIFDLENTTTSKITREFFLKNSKIKNVIYVDNELPKSFVLTKENKIYVTSLSESTLAKRFNRKNILI